MPTLADILRAAGVLTPVEALGSDPALPTLTVAGSAAVPMWHKLHRLAPKTGHLPVILGERDSTAERLGDLKFSPFTTAQLLRNAESLTAGQWLAEERAARPDLFSDLDEGSWPAPRDVPPAPAVTLPFDGVTGRPYPSVTLALVPTAIPHEVPAHLLLGNPGTDPGLAAPSPLAHITMLRHWHARHGAELVCATPELIEFHIATPPATREAALVLAREQYVYCPALLDEYETISSLAAVLLDSSVWRFEWD